MLKRIISVLGIIIVTLVVTMPNVKAKEQVNLYLFWGDGCPHCAAEKEYLSELQKEYDNLNVNLYEVWYNEENEAFLDQIATELNENFNGVPVTIIGQTVITGFSTSTEQQLRRAVSYYSENKHQNMVEEIKNGTYEAKEKIPDEEFQKEEKKIDKDTSITLPMIGNVNFKNYDLTTAIPILGLLSAFSLPLLWLFLTAIIISSTKSTEKERFIHYFLAILLLTISSTASAFLNANFIHLLSRLLIIIISASLAISILQKRKYPKHLTTVLLVIFAILAGFLANPQYLTIVNTLIETNDLSIWIQILTKIGFLLTMIVTYIALIIAFSFIWNKVKEDCKNKIQIAVLILTMIVMIFL